MLRIGFIFARWKRTKAYSPDEVWRSLLLEY